MEVTRRSLRIAEEVEEAGMVTTVGLSPLSSFAWRWGTAASFAGCSQTATKTPCVIFGVIPGTHILGNAVTGFGYHGEYEFVVLGGHRVWVAAASESGEIAVGQFAARRLTDLFREWVAEAAKEAAVREGEYDDGLFKVVIEPDGFVKVFGGKVSIGNIDDDPWNADWLKTTPAGVENLLMHVGPGGLDEFLRDIGCTRENFERLPIARALREYERRQRGNRGKR